MFLTFFWMINIGNYRELLLKLFVWSLSWENVIFFENLMKRKLSLFGWLHFVSWIPSAGRRWVSTDWRFCLGVVGVYLIQLYYPLALYLFSSTSLTLSLSCLLLKLSSWSLSYLAFSFVLFLWLTKTSVKILCIYRSINTYKN